MTACECSTKLYHVQDFIIRFLKGLDDRFGVVRCQVLFMVPLLTLIFSMVIQHERQYPDVVLSTKETNSFANAAITRDEINLHQQRKLHKKKCS